MNLRWWSLRRRPNARLLDEHLHGRRSWWRRHRTLAIVLGTILGLLLLLVGISLPNGLKLAREAKAAKASFLKAQDAGKRQEFAVAKTDLAETTAHLSNAQMALRGLPFLKILPIVRTQLAVVDDVLTSSIQLSRGIGQLTEWAQRTFAPLQGTDVTFSALPVEAKRSFLKNLSEAEPDLQGVKANIDLAVQAVNAIPERGVLRPVRNVVDPFVTQLRDVQSSIAQAVPLSRFLPPVVGYPSAQTYLFLLQNNTELRPAGGFIGTYGIVRLRDADIVSFRTDNSYNLDGPARGKVVVAPPAPLAKYNFSEGWFFRDSNWSPDFPTAAKEAERFYRLEGGTESIDGVIAVTPTFIASLLKLTGPIEVNGEKVTADSLLEFLRFQVDEGYLREGLPFSERKEIIGVLADKLLQRLLDLPKSRWLDLWHVIENDIGEKHVLLSLDDPELQTLALSQNWAGALLPATGDALLVVDANLGSLKSDPFVHRSIDYRVKREGDRLVATVTVTYDHQGELSKTVTRYRSYTRVYVPKGSELVSSEGQMVNCKVTRPGTLDTSEEFDRSVFGVFTCTEPGEKRTLTFTYRLPTSLNALVDAGRYDLLVQKQAGTLGYPLRVQLDLPEEIDTVQPLDGASVTVENGTTVSTDLKRDRHLQFTLKR